eukprot:gene12965-15236_t
MKFKSRKIDCRVLVRSTHVHIGSVYKDILGYYKDELFSDAFEIKEVGGCMYEVKSKMEKFDTKITVNTGANASEEETEEEGGEDASSIIMVNNLVQSHRLSVTSFDKKSYLTYLKGYLKSVEAWLAERKPERVAAFKAACQEQAKAIVGSFDKYTFYQGENMDAEGMVALSYMNDSDPNTIYFLFWMDGVKDEKY